MGVTSMFTTAGGSIRKILENMLPFTALLDAFLT